MNRIIECAVYFFRLGCLGFGGPLAVIAQIQRDLVEKRGWMSQDDFLTALPMIKALPGPIAFQTSVFLGRHRAGFLGACVAALGVVFPAFLLMVIFGMLSSVHQENSQLSVFLTGLQISALGVILASIRSIVMNYYKSAEYWFFAVVAAFLLLKMDWYEPVVIIFIGVSSVVYFKIKSRKKSPITPLALFFFGNSMPLASDHLSSLAGVCLRAGAFVFGTGVAIVPILEHDFVQNLHWITHREFLEALALGQVTPGPVVITVTYIGYKVAGMAGAVVATVSIFLPSFVHMVTWFPRFVKRMARQRWIKDFLLGSNAAVACSIFLAVITLGQSMKLNKAEMLLAMGVFTLSLWGRVATWLLIPLGGLIYWATMLV